MRPIRWTVVATQVPAGGSLGGVVRYTTEFIRALGAREDVEVSAVATRSAADTVAELVGDRARVAVVPDAPAPVLSLAERYAPLRALRHGPDVVHGVKHLLPQRSDALRVLTVHDMLLLDRPQDFGAGKRLMLPAPYRASIRDAGLLLCVSAATRARMAASVPGSQDRAEVVHLATSGSLHAAPSTPLAALRERRFVLVVGDPTPRKNLGTIVSAWDEVRRLVPDLVLAVAGPPSWGRTEVGPQYEALVADGAVVPLGHVADGELRWAYENCLLVLAPSLAEGFGLPAAEALEFGAPVIISTDPAMQEVAAGRALAVLPALDTGAWAAAVVEASRTAVRRAPVPGRTWADVVDESVRAVQARLSPRPVAPGRSA